MWRKQGDGEGVLRSLCSVTTVRLWYGIFIWDLCVGITKTSPGRVGNRSRKNVQPQRGVKEEGQVKDEGNLSQEEVLRRVGEFVYLNVTGVVEVGTVGLDGFTQPYGRGVIYDGPEGNKIKNN